MRNGSRSARARADIIITLSASGATRFLPSLPFLAPRSLPCLPRSAVPLYLYLDERHVPWMTDATLHAALADLRPMYVAPPLPGPLRFPVGTLTRVTVRRLLKKFHDEDPRTGKKSSVEVHRGGTFPIHFHQIPPPPRFPAIDSLADAA